MMSKILQFKNNENTDEENHIDYLSKDVISSIDIYAALQNIIFTAGNAQETISKENTYTKADFVDLVDIAMEIEDIINKKNRRR